MRVPNKFIICSLSSLLLAGCASADVIQRVKDSPYPDYPRKTVSELMDNRKMCEATSWEVSKSAGYETIVSYRCAMKKIRFAYSEEVYGKQLVLDIYDRIGGLKPYQIINFVVDKKGIRIRDCEHELYDEDMDKKPIYAASSGDATLCTIEGKKKTVGSDWVYSTLIAGYKRHLFADQELTDRMRQAEDAVPRIVTPKGVALNKVRNGYYLGDTTRTTAEILDNYKGCISKRWLEIDLKTGTVLVGFKCEINAHVTYDKETYGEQLAADLNRRALDFKARKEITFTVKKDTVKIRSCAHTLIDTTSNRNPLRGKLIYEKDVCIREMTSENSDASRIEGLRMDYFTNTLDFEDRLKAKGLGEK